MVRLGQLGDGIDYAPPPDVANLFGHDPVSLLPELEMVDPGIFHVVDPYLDFQVHRELVHSFAVYPVEETVQNVDNLHMSGNNLGYFDDYDLPLSDVWERFYLEVIRCRTCYPFAGEPPFSGVPTADSCMELQH